MARQLKVEIVGDSRDLERALARSERAARRFAGSVAAVFAGVGVTKIFTDTVKAAEEAQRVMAQTRKAVELSGLSWEKYGRQIEEVTLAQSKMSGFDDERLKATFSLLVRRTGDVTEALRLNALATDVARGANIDLEQAAKIVQRASAGQARGLATLGIEYSKTTTAAELLQRLQEKYAGSAAAYANTAAGAQDRFRVAVENLQEAIGAQLLPTITEYANKAADWLNDADNQKRIVDDFTKSINALAEAFKYAAATIGFFYNAWTSAHGFLKDLGPGGKFDFRNVGEAQAVLNAPFIPDWVKDVIRQGIANTPGVGRGMDAVESGRITGQLRPSAGFSGGARAGSFLSPTAFSGPLISFLNKYKQANDRILAAQKAADAYQKRMESKRGWLDFGLERAQATSKISDDRVWLRKIEAYLKERIRHEGRKLELVRDLWRTRQQIRDLNKKNSDDPLAGLTQVSTTKLTRMLAAGTGLGSGGLSALQHNISAAALQPVYVTVQLDGREVARSVTQHQARTQHRTARQTSGFRG